MGRYSFYVDGFNVYYALNDNRRYRKYKWLDYRRLAELVIGPKDSVADVFYFTAFVVWKPQKVATHRLYIDALKSHKVKVVRGRFKDKEQRCHICNQSYWTHEEKRTDVNIALRVLGDACSDLYDKAVIISADSDLLPVIEAVRELAPAKQVGVMPPIGRDLCELANAADFKRKMREKLLRQAQFPDTVHVGTKTIKRPPHWR